MAESIVLDLRFRVIPPDHDVFIVFPGQNYFLYEFFVATQRIFPELPGLDLVPGKAIDEQPDLERKVARARRIAAWHQGSKKGDAPSRQLADYHAFRKNASFANTYGVLTGFFGRAKKGDLVVVPPAQYFQKALIGELLDDPEDFEPIVVPRVWENEAVPSRKVRWLASPLRADLSVDLQRRFPSPNAFRKLDREARAEIYSFAYGSYSVEDSYTARFDVTAAEFNTVDDYYLQQIFNVIAAGCQLIDEGAAFGDIQSIGDLVARLSNPAYIPDLQVNINSPGSLVLSCAKLVPFVVSAILALSLLGAETTWSAAAADQIQVINSEAPNDDECTLKVADEVKEQLKMMGMERWQELCKKAQQLRQRTGLEEKSKAEKQ
jgi:hypothetical protein